ncbi:MAG: hypothetical protein ACLFUY_10415, partial [Desulfobacterales bacterium]
ITIMSIMAVFFITLPSFMDLRNAGWFKNQCHTTDFGGSVGEGRLHGGYKSIKTNNFLRRAL